MRSNSRSHYSQPAFRTPTKTDRLPSPYRCTTEKMQIQGRVVLWGPGCGGGAAWRCGVMPRCGVRAAVTRVCSGPCGDGACILAGHNHGGKAVQSADPARSRRVEMLTGHNCVIRPEESINPALSAGGAMLTVQDSRFSQRFEASFVLSATSIPRHRDWARTSTAC